MMGVSRTRSAGAKVTDEEYAQLEALAQARGVTLGEWCRDVLLAQLKPTVASLPEESDSGRTSRPENDYDQSAARSRK